MNLEEVTKLKAFAERKQREADRAEGEYTSLLRQAKDEFGVSDLEALERLAKKLSAQASKDTDEAEAALAEFTKQYGDLLGG